ncbi:MAG: HAMP domain-containing histidine kinase [Clostridiales bacterium]|jgi:signal transduction histidine kinase|nr:HAMP domain-containing histidine kinase [Clostridiales bacterium]
MNLTSNAPFCGLQNNFSEELYHDIKTPLTILYNNLQNLERVSDLPEQAVTYVRNAKRNWYRMAKLVHDANDSARLIHGLMLPQMRNNDIVNAVRVLVEDARVLTDQKRIRLIFESRVASRVMAFDRQILERILLNLLSNAAHYSCECGEILVALRESHENMHISVRDYGPGIPQETDVFARNVSDNLRGEHSGLGLFIVRELATLTGGEVYMSRAEPGTEAVLKLPVGLTDDGMDELPVDDFFYDNMVQMELSY